MGKKSKPPPPPDYTKLAEQTAASQKAAVEAQTQANRPNQTDVYGNTSTWTKDANGNWTQVQKLSDTNQSMLDYQNQAMRAAMERANASLSNPIDMSGLPEYTTYDFSKLSEVPKFDMNPYGNSKEIQDATYALSAPYREQARAAEIQRLKNQGLTEDSPAFQRAIQRLDTGDTDAQLKSLLAGTQEYGNIYNRALNANKLAMALREQQFGEQGANARMNAAVRSAILGEREDMRDQPLEDLAHLTAMKNFYTPAYGSFTNQSAPGGAVDYTKAGESDYKAQLDYFNAKKAASNSKTQGLFTIAGAIAGSFFGQPVLGASLGSMVGGAVTGGSAAPSSSSSGVGSSIGGLFDMFKGSGTPDMQAAPVPSASMWS